MTPAARIKKLICDHVDEFPQLNEKHVYAYAISAEENTETQPILVISELPRRGHTYGNGVVIDERRRVQITFYYPRDYQEDEEGLEEHLESFLIRYGYFNYSNAGHVLSPDNRKITNTLKFNYVKEII